MRFNLGASRLLTLAAASLFLLGACNNNKVEDANDRDPDQAQMSPQASNVDSSTAPYNNDNNVNRDLNFYEEAARGSMFEIQASQIALQKTKNPQVRQFAQMMVNDHQKAAQQLQDLAQRKQILLPTELPNGKRDKLEDLRNDEQGEDFDEEYLEAMVDAHEDDVDLFDRQANNGQDADARALAQQLLPTLRQHHDQAKRLEEQVDDNDGNSRRNRSNTSGSTPR